MNELTDLHDSDLKTLEIYQKFSSLIVSTSFLKNIRIRAIPTMPGSESTYSAKDFTSSTSTLELVLVAVL